MEFVQEGNKVFAVVISGVVDYVCRVDPFTLFEPAFAASMVECPPDTQQGWTYLDGVFSPPEEVSPPAKTEEQVKAEILAQVQENLDNFAREKNYDGILSLASYKDSTNPTFAAQAVKGIYLRDTSWATLYSILAQVDAGEMPQPNSYTDIAHLLPVLTWND